MNIPKLQALINKTLPVSLESKQLACCDITGISIILYTPAIPDIALTYTNPLAYSTNFLPMAALPYSSLLKADKVILAGLLLAALKHRNLLEKNPSSLSPVEQNLLLQTLSPSYLISLFKFFSAVSKDTAELLPKRSLLNKDVMEKQKSNIKDVLDDYLKNCSCILAPMVQTKEEREINSLVERADNIIMGKISSANLIKQKAIAEAKKTKARLQEDGITRGRKIIKELAIASTLSDKLLQFVKTLFQGDTLLTTEPPIKQRLATALQKHVDDALAIELSQIILNKSMNNEVDSIFPSIETRQEQEEIADLDKEVAKLSLKDRIALIKQNQAEQQQQEAKRSI